MSDCITDDDCDVFRTGAPAKNHCDWTAYPSTRRKVYRTLQRPCLLCCGEAAAVGTRVPPEAEVFEIVHNPRLLTCYALCQTCRTMPRQQQEPLIDAVLSLP